MNNPWDQITPPLDDVIARRIDHEHPLDLFWARDHLGHYLFVYEFLSQRVERHVLPELTGIRAVLRSTDTETSKQRLILALTERGNWEIFFSLCTDLILATRELKDANTGLAVVLRRLARWQEFLKKAHTNLLSEDAIKGLMGELIFIWEHLIPRFGAAQSIQFWQGPIGLPQDFNVNSSAIEVKCQSGVTLPTVRISSPDQLSPQLPEMYLCVYTLGRTVPTQEQALNLPLLTGRIRDKLQEAGGGQLERFNDLLYSIGYLDIERYIEYSYLCVSETMFSVVEGFPRICSEDLHPGIVKCSYTISLSDCEPFKGYPHWMEDCK